MEYEPCYAKGQVVVDFKGICNNKGFATQFCGELGFNLSNEDYESGDGFIILTEDGKEDDIINRLQNGKYSEFVSGAYLRDLKMEQRWREAEEGLAMFEELRDNAELPDDEYLERLREIRRHIDGLEKKLS